MRFGQDTRLVANTDSTILYLAPGGLQGLYRPVTGTSNHTPLVGFKNHLAKNGTSGWLLTDHATRAVPPSMLPGTLTKVTDRNEETTTLAYSSTTQKPTSITSTRGGNACKATMTSTGGLLTSMTQPSDTSGSRTVSHGYDTANQRLTSITDTGGGVSTLTWDPTSGDLTSIKDPSTTVLTFTYDSSRRVTSSPRGPRPGPRPSPASPTPPPPRPWSPARTPTRPSRSPRSRAPRTPLDGTDRVTQAVDEPGRTRAASYTTAHADLASTTSPGGGVSTAQYNANSGSR